MYLERIETDASRVLNFANGFACGMFDTLLLQARANEVICFRTRVGQVRLGAATDYVKWNGQRQV